jgi:prevent-host-death family protein
VYTFSVHKKDAHHHPARVGIRELRSNLSRYLQRAQDGQVIEVTSRDAVVAELRPVAQPKRGASRKPGALKGRIRIGPDFDTLPPELIDAFER